MGQWELRDTRKQIDGVCGKCIGGGNVSKANGYDAL